MNLAHWLARTASAQGDRPALLIGEEVVANYEDFHARAASVAYALRERGIAPGDRVGIFMRNCPEYLIAFFGIWTAGAVAVPINAKLHPREAEFILSNSGAELCFVGPDTAMPLSGVTALPQIDVVGTEFRNAFNGPKLDIVPRDPADLAWLFYTSGTTGRPKGVQITHGMLAATSLAYPVDVDRVDASDAALYAAPMSHGAGLYALIHVLRGARHLCPASGGFDAGEVLDLSAEHGPVSMFLAPTMVRRLTDAAAERDCRGDGIRTIVYGGGPMYRADIVDALDRFGPKFVQIYGQGECPMAITALPRDVIADRQHPNWPNRIESVGPAQSVVEISIRNEDGESCETGHSGEICVRGLPVMPGYWNNPNATAKVMRDGWLLTGDIGRMDADGYLTLQDRSKDVIISGGSNIYPREVEEALLSHPSVYEVSVVGRVSPEWGEEVVAFVVASPAGQIDTEALDAHCVQQIARFKRPKDYIVVSDLPKNNYGKVLKTALRARLSATIAR